MDPKHGTVVSNKGPSGVCRSTQRLGWLSISKGNLRAKVNRYRTIIFISHNVGNICTYVIFKCMQIVLWLIKFILRVLLILSYCIPLCLFCQSTNYHQVRSFKLVRNKNFPFAKTLITPQVQDNGFHLPIGLFTSRQVTNSPGFLMRKIGLLLL